MPVQLTLKQALGRPALIAVEVIVFLLAVGWIAKTYIAQVVARTVDIKHLQLAIRLDPQNSQYHLSLGRLYEYVPASLDATKAMHEFRTAVQLSPYDPEAWINLGAALEFDGKIEEAEACLRRTDELAPKIPVYQWPIGNFFLLHGNTTEAFQHFKVVLAGTRQYDQIIFGTAWKASENPGEILNQLVPRDLPAEFSYLSFLLDHQHFEEADPVWKRILTSPAKFAPQQAAGYIDSLIHAHKANEAYRVWSDLGDEGLIRNAGPTTRGSLITNGDFEDEMLNMGFGWRIVPVPDVYAGVDTSTYHSPNHALLVQFMGKENLDYRRVYQYVKVSPNRSYRLQVFMKTDGITTDSGPRLEVRDVYNPRDLDTFSDGLTGSTDGWTPVHLDFKTGAKTELIVVNLARLRSKKLDNLIQGKVWVDDVKLVPLTP